MRTAGSRAAASFTHSSATVLQHVQMFPGTSCVAHQRKLSLSSRRDRRASVVCSVWILCIPRFDARHVSVLVVIKIKFRLRHPSLPHDTWVQPGQRLLAAEIRPNVAERHLPSPAAAANAQDRPDVKPCPNACVCELGNRSASQVFFFF